jgi:outer membrane protein OmpA-like peptidoglycan-associated protein
MFSQDDESTGLVMGVIFGVIALVISLIIGLSIYQKNKAVKAQAAMAAVSAPASATVAADAASVVVEGGVVKFYFASGKADLPQGGPQALADVIAGTAAGKKAVVSGFVDSTGSAEQNKEVSKQRAFAVRDLLKGAGVAEDKIELKKPEDIQAGSGAQARRVEVTLQ